ncbi:hypothetical protein PSTG_07196 [Puccinia striiformis f. sp. tritici PST-78]|uniref:Uncharacterized protein n=1 Tax=Puccinia striiformis f. sp. tritici PST-78 TaxID=1165861 RepID=A0A0L0VJP1_9BASI|nr:hypothetical protein PSTG_07196 [Puccinia striiformis f. sp. tritici PST-78]
MPSNLRTLSASVPLLEADDIRTAGKPIFESHSLDVLSLDSWRTRTGASSQDHSRPTPGTFPTTHPTPAATTQPPTLTTQPPVPSIQPTGDATAQPAANATTANPPPATPTPGPSNANTPFPKIRPERNPPRFHPIFPVGCPIHVQIPKVPRSETEENYFDPSRSERPDEHSPVPINFHLEKDWTAGRWLRYKAMRTFELEPRPMRHPIVERPAT